MSDDKHLTDEQRQEPPHLPECYTTGVSHFAKPCICDRLRKAEQRVMGLYSPWKHEHDRGWNDALDTIAQLVKAREHDGDYCLIVHACDITAAATGLRRG